MHRFFPLCNTSLPNPPGKKLGQIQFLGNVIPIDKPPYRKMCRSRRSLVQWCLDTHFRLSQYQDSRTVIPAECTKPIKLMILRSYRALQKYTEAKDL